MACLSLKELVARVVPKSRDWQTVLFAGWQFAVGDLHQHMRLERVDGSRLVVAVYDSHWMHELFMLAPAIIKAVNEYIGSPEVSHIKFTLARSRRRSSSLKENDSAKVKKDLGESRESAARPQIGARHELVLRSVKDDELQEVLRGFFNRCVF
ncbi:MAG: DUF721 domain-containing protein [Candidatus Babeliaceae bacterium]|nr:DUF721 domain-containing protein [Candidatus Babeliaceae bacterium]